MARFQVSKFKNIELCSATAFGPGPSVNITEWPTATSNLIASSGCLVASLSGQGRISVTDASPQQKELFKIHSDSICDLDFSPFRDDLLVVSSLNRHASLFEFPITINDDQSISSSTRTPRELCKVLSENVTCTRFHPMIPEVLIQSSDRELVFYRFDCASKEFDKVHSNSFSSDQRLLHFATSQVSRDYAVLNENSGLNVFDPRISEPIQQATFKTTSKSCSRVAFIENSGNPFLLTTADNTVQIWDRRSLLSPVSSISNQMNDSKLIPIVDHNTGLVFFVTYNSGLIVVTEEKNLQSGKDFSTAFSTYLPHKLRSVCLASKRSLKYELPEINRLYGLTEQKIIPMQFTIPRKVPQQFFPEYFPPTKSPFSDLKWSNILSEEFLQIPFFNLNPQAFDSVEERFNFASKAVKMSNDPEAQPIRIEEKPPKQPEKNTEEEEDVLLQRSINPKGKFLKGTVDLKKKIEFQEEIYDGLSTMKLLHSGMNVAVMPIGRTACDSVCFVNLANGNQHTFMCANPITNFAVYPFEDRSKIPVFIGTLNGDLYWIDVGFSDDCLDLSSTHFENCHDGAIGKVAFHPRFANTLITLGKEDCSVKIWNLDANRRSIESICSQQLSSPNETIYEFAWSKFVNGGNKLAVLVKTKDAFEKIEIFEYRNKTFTKVHEIVLPKFCFMVSLDWILADDFIMATGRSRGDMMFFIWDCVDNYRLVTELSVDSNPYALYANLDEDTGTLLLIPKGDRQIYIYGLQFELEKRNLTVHRYDPFQTATRVLGCTFGHKVNCDVMKMEIANGLILSDGFIAPFSLVIPRKMMGFFDDSLFPKAVVTWRPWFADQFEMTRPEQYAETPVVRESLQPPDSTTMSAVSVAKTTAVKAQDEERQRITINQTIDNPYLAMRVKEKIESSLSQMISSFTVDVEPIEVNRKAPCNEDDDDEDDENDWD